MSVNISLADTPGVSAFFDGQPIQDELEAEIRREEERQQKELRDLLATELEDFEDDFLSDSNSEEDSVNVSRVSRASSHHKIKNNDNSKPPHQASKQMVELDSDRGQDYQRKENNTEPDHAQFFSPVSQRHQTNFQTSQEVLQQQQQQQQQRLQPHPQPDHQFHHQQQQDLNYQQQRMFAHGAEYDLTPTPGGPAYSATTDTDEWMMRVQTQASPYYQPSQQQQQQQHQPNYYHSLPQSNPGVMENPPLPIPNHLLHHNPSFPSPLAKSTPIQPTAGKPKPPSEASPLASSPHPTRQQESSRQNPVPDGGDEYDNYQVRYKSKAADVNENDFYIQNENVEFFKADGGEQQRTYQQLEILYQARGRELDDMGWKMSQAEEDTAKEVRMYKHKLALTTAESEGGQESLRQCQSLLQQAKSDLAETQGLVKSLETQVATYKEAKEELIKKLQVAESTVENLSHQCEQLQQSESLSRARNEHESVVTSLTQRFDRELVSVKEKWDETKNNLSAKHDEVLWLKKQLADSTKELEQAQISRGESINRLAKSLEDSQKQCQALLEQSTSQEVASLKVKLHQTVASKSISEDMCVGLQSEIKELKEQLSMFETASTLGVFAPGSIASTHKVSGGPSLDDSMTDLGIKKTLDFDTPSSTPKLAETSSLEDLVTSLRTELEKCLYSNRQKRSEIAGQTGEVQRLKQELRMAEDKSQDLEKTCANQKSRLTDLESLMSSSNGGSLVEVRLRRDLDALAKEKALLLEDIEDYKKRVEEVGASEARLTEINTELSAQIAHMVTDFDADKGAALDRCQRTLEEVHSMTIENLRTELESRLASEKAMVSECHKAEMDRLQGQRSCALEEAHTVKALYIQTCNEMKKQEDDTRSMIRQEVEEELIAVWKSKEGAKETVLVQEERNKRDILEANFQKEKESWEEKAEMFAKEIKASNDVIAELKSSHDKDVVVSEQKLGHEKDVAIAELKSSHEKDVAGLQETLSSLKSQHEDEVKAWEEKLSSVISCHQTDMNKMQEELGRNDRVESEWKNKYDQLEKQYKQEKEELENMIEQKRLNSEGDLSQSSKLSSNHTVVLSGVVEEVCVQTDTQMVEGARDKTPDSLRTKLAQIESDLQTTKREHASFVEKLKLEHKKENERAARSREEKFQVELRYFLKEREDKSKAKLEQAVKKRVEHFKVALENWLEKSDLKFKIDMEQLKSDLNLTASSRVDVNETETEENLLKETIEKLEEQKAEMERKITELEQEKKEEILRLVETHAKKEKAVIEKYTNEFEVLSQRHKEECEGLRRRLKELETAEKPDNRLDSEEMEEIVNVKVQEGRVRWFKEAQDYIQSEIDAGLKGKLSADNTDVATKDLRKEDVEDEIKARVEEKLGQEIEKLKVEEAEKERNNEKTIKTKVKQKLSVEIENLKTKFLSELEMRVNKEKAQLEEDVKRWKEEMKRKIDEDKQLFVSQMSQEMEEKISEEKKRVEEVMMRGREEDMKQMRAEMEEEMRKRLEKEKRDWYKELKGEESLKNEEMALRERLHLAEEACAKALREKEQTVEVVKRREAIFKEDKQKMMTGLKQFRLEFNSLKEEHIILEKQYADMDKRYKEDMKEAKRMKEQALGELQTRANREKEELLSDYHKQIASMKEDFSNEMDRVTTEAEVDRAALLMEVRSHTERALTLSPLQEPDAETTTLFELRDHYLETVAKIKEDVMGHVQAANSRAASTMKTEMRKQRRRLVQVFRDRCKVAVHSILTGQVTGSVFNSLDHAVDVIAEAMVTSSKSTKSTSSPSTPRSDPNALLSTNQDNADEAKMKRRHQNLPNHEHRGDSNTTNYENITLREVSKSKQSAHSYATRLDEQEQFKSHKNHPQLSKVDLYDSEAAGSSPQTSAKSSPASAAPRSRSVIHGSYKSITESQVPPLNLTPFQTAQQTKHSTPASDSQQYSHYNTKAYSGQSKRRPLSAESALVSRSQQMGVDSRQGSKSTKTYSNARDRLDDKSQLEKTDESLTSPRERMKMIEARVRLANWAASGEMPWKSRSSKAGSGTTTNPEQENEVSSTCQQDFSDDKYYSLERVGRNDDNVDENVFVRPGKEAEMFLKAQKSAKRRNDGLITPSKKEREESLWKSPEKRIQSHKCVTRGIDENRPGERDGYLTDESSLSNESHSSSFITLEPDPAPGTRIGYQSSKEQAWSTFTSDYDRIKAAVFDKSEKGHSNVFNERGPDQKVDAVVPSSDDDGISVDSDDGPHYHLLPTSTPAKRYDSYQKDEKRSQMRTMNSEPARKVTNSKLSSNSKDARNGERSSESEPEEWKTIDAFSSYPRYQDSTAHSKQKPSHKSKDVAKSIDFEIADISEITQAPDDRRDGGGGRGMWKYRSLDDLLPHQAKRLPGRDGAGLGKVDERQQSDYRNHIADDLISRGSDTRLASQPRRAPVQAMDSDFWTRQSLEEENEEKKRVDQRRLASIEQRDKYSTHLQPHKHNSPSSGHSNHYTTSEDYRDPRILLRKNPSNAPSAEASWGKNRQGRNPVNPPASSSSPPSYTKETRSRTSPLFNSKPQPHHHSRSPYSPFDAHVEDLRKSLETMEKRPFSTTPAGKTKSKMKRSVSEQSLHTICWDNDLQDIDDLVTAYTTGGVQPSQFDLHTFGNEDRF